VRYGLLVQACCRCRLSELTSLKIVFPHAAFEELEMPESLPVLMENSIQIAWDFLDRTGEIEDTVVASRFLGDTVELMIRRGERRRLLLSNKAITAYMRFKKQRTEQAA
jgi:hypothetical protein